MYTNKNFLLLGLMMLSVTLTFTSAALFGDTTNSDSFFSSAFNAAYENSKTKLVDTASEVLDSAKEDYQKVLNYDYDTRPDIEAFRNTNIGKAFEESLAVMPGSPTYDTFVSRASESGVRNPVTTALKLDSCYDSSLGSEDEINDLYNGILASDNGAIKKANQLQSILRLITTEEKNEMLLQIFTIYADASSDSPSASTLTVLTPECMDAFNYFSVSVDSAHGILNGDNVQCKNFQSDVVDLSLCTAEPTTLLKQHEGEAQVYYNVSGYLNNNGPKLCNVTFYVHNLDQAIEYSPAWLPFYDDSHPEGLPSGSSTEVWALVPKDSVEPTLPYLDIVNTFYICDTQQEIVEDQNTDTEETVGPVVSKEDKFINEQDIVAEDNPSSTQSTSCFSTVACVREISSIVSDACASYDTLLTSSCHQCSGTDMKSAKQECKNAGCSSKQCHLDLDMSSPASLVSTSSFIAIVTLASIASLAFNI